MGIEDPDSDSLFFSIAEYLTRREALKYVLLTAAIPLLVEKVRFNCLSSASHEQDVGVPCLECCPLELDGKFATTTTTTAATAMKKKKGCEGSFSLCGVQNWGKVKDWVRDVVGGIANGEEVQMTFGIR